MLDRSHLFPKNVSGILISIKTNIKKCNLPLKNFSKASPYRRNHEKWGFLKCHIFWQFSHGNVPTCGDFQTKKLLLLAILAILLFCIDTTTLILLAGNSNVTHFHLIFSARFLIKLNLMKNMNKIHY